MNNTRTKQSHNSIHFFFQNHILKVKEADILSITCLKAKDEPNKKPAPYILHPRAFRIAFLYQKLFEVVRRSFFVVGIKVMNQIQFDGYLFHELYNQMIKDKNANYAPELDKCSKEIKMYHNYSFMAVTSDSEYED